ncbi:MAG: ATP-binding protein [Holosporaceae bacterium]|jgi:response regulator of citrate/malate metabolism|nr:ATP-binding protein [Holosporaceae bacterium]
MVLKNVITSIRDITDNLLNKCKPREDAYSQLDGNPYVFVSLALSEAINYKKYQYNRLNIKFNYFFDSENKFIFIKGDQSIFRRMISNLIDNAVETLDEKAGIVDLTLKEEESLIKIIIEDNGKGMSQTLIDKMYNNTTFSNNKEKGLGVGLEQVRDALLTFNGQMSVESKENVGTKVRLFLPISENPQWVAQQIRLNKGSTVVILDDDTSMHYVWKTYLGKYSDSLSFEYFENGEEAIEFIQSIEDKNKVFLLSDCELRNQRLNGIQIIKHLSMQDKSVLVTSDCNNKKIQNTAWRTNIKILPKLLISEITITIEN